MIKSLGSLLAGHPVISGTARSVTGEVILILNLSALARWVSPARLVAGLAGSRRRRSVGADRRAPSLLSMIRSASARSSRGNSRRWGWMSTRSRMVWKRWAGYGIARYGLVVTDLEMPRLDGFELLAEMRRNIAAGRRYR